MKKLFILAIVVLGFASVSFAQNAVASATGTVVPATGFVQTGNNLDFGIFAPGTAAGTVTVDPTGNRTADNAQLAGGTATAAHFTLTNNDGTFDLVIPTSPLVLTGNGTGVGTNTMSVSAWTSTPTAGTGLTTATYATDIYVGATIAVAADQRPGVYTSTTGFTVTVNNN